MGARLMWDRGSVAISAWKPSWPCAHYGARVRSRVVGWALAIGLAVAAPAACSTGGGGAGNLASGTQPQNYGVLCGLIAQLPAAATQLQRVDVRDPGPFKTTLDNAVQQYVGILDQIAPRVDSKLKSTVSEVRRLVLAHRFGDAGDARVPLDTWTADHC